MPALQPVSFKCFVTRDASVHAGEVWPWKQFQKMEQVEEVVSGELSVCHFFLNRVFHGMRQAECDIKENKGVCNQMLSVWGVLILLLT